jgi:hypothetical protein
MGMAMIDAPSHLVSAIETVGSGKAYRAKKDHEEAMRKAKADAAKKG